MNAVAEADFEVVGEEPFFAPASTDMIGGLLGQFRQLFAQAFAELRAQGLKELLEVICTIGHAADSGERKAATLMAARC